MSQSSPEFIEGTTARHAVEDVATYPRPPVLQVLRYPISIVLDGQQIVSTRSAYRVPETFHPPTYYIPPDDVAEGVLSPIPRQSVCEWKGPARYFNVHSADRVQEAAAWCYLDPVEAFAPIKDYLAFYCDPMDTCLVDGVRATPQPGGFYGGWITPWIVGRIKGAPGTNHW
jgi:uncharacterized protein (DUF427 family)